MANHGPVYGLSRDLMTKNNSRFDVGEAIDVLCWIEHCTGRPMEPSIDDVHNAVSASDPLIDGVQLCLLAERLVGSDNIHFHRRPKMPFHKMENISSFLDAVKRYGVPEITCFQTVDLYERKQLYKVFECLRSLAGIAAKHRASVPIPEFAVRYAEGARRDWDPSVLAKGNAIISLQYGYNKGASQAGMTPYGLPRQIFMNGRNAATTEGTAGPKSNGITNGH